MIKIKAALHLFATGEHNQGWIYCEDYSKSKKRESNRKGKNMEGVHVRRA